MDNKELYDEFSVDAILDEVKKLNRRDSETAAEAPSSFEGTGDSELDDILAGLSKFRTEYDAEDVSDTDSAIVNAASDYAHISADEENKLPDIKLMDFDRLNLDESRAPANKDDFAKIEPENDAAEETAPEINEVGEEKPVFEETAYEELAPLIDGAGEETSEEDGAPETEEEVYVPGQISIEKTRVFNEVQARPVHKEDIEHQIGVPKVIKTGDIPNKSSTDPYRDRFFNKPELNIEKTRDHIKLMQGVPKKTIERVGVVVKKNDLQKTDANGLSPLPTLVDAAEEYDAQHRRELESGSGALSANAFEEDDNQIKLEGFQFEEDRNIVNEDEAEKELYENRKFIVENFKLYPEAEDEEEETETAEASEAEEDESATRVFDAEAIAEQFADESEVHRGIKYRRKRAAKRERVRVERELFGPKDFKAVKAIFDKQYSRTKLRLIITAVCFGILLLSAVATSFFDSFALFGDSPVAYSTVNILLLFTVGALNYSSFKTAFEKAFKKQADYNTAISVAIIIGIFQSLVSLAYPDLVLSGTHIYAAVALFGVLMINIGEFLKLDNDIKNFRLLEKNQGAFWEAKSVEDEEQAFEIGRGLMIREPDVRYCAKVSFPYKFVEMTKAVNPTDEVYKLALPITLAAAFLIGIVSLIINKNLFIGITSFTGVTLMAMPAAVGISVFGLLRKVNEKLNSGTSLISGYEAVENAFEANAVVVDAADLFEHEAARIEGVKLFNDMRIDEAILYTAAFVLDSNGPLRDAFDATVGGNRDMIPPVESLAYEDKLGCSGWIYNYRVLVGSRDLLLKHNVEVQTKQEEDELNPQGNPLVYLAVEGKVAAMFAVSYSANETIAKYLRYLEKSGVNILVRTTDANITEELVEQRFGLPRNFVKVISPVAGVMLKDLVAEETENEPCRILSDGRLRSFLYSFANAFVLKERSKIGIFLQYIGVGISILLMAMFSFLSGMAQAGVLQTILFEVLWSLLVIFIPRIKKL